MTQEMESKGIKRMASASNKPSLMVFFRFGLGTFSASMDIKGLSQNITKFEYKTFVFNPILAIFLQPFKNLNFLSYFATVPSSLCE